MARVSINDRVHGDTRLSTAARALRLCRERLAFRLVSVWSQVTERGSAVMSVYQVASALRKDDDAVAHALCIAELADDIGGGLLDLEPLRSIYGDYEWFQESAATAERGGISRAATAQRDPVTGQFLPRDIRAEICELLGDGQARTRTELQRELKANRKGVLSAVSSLIAAGQIEQDDQGQLTVTACRELHGDIEDRFPGSTAGSTVSSTAGSTVSSTAAMEPVPRAPQNPATASAPSPAPSLAPATTTEEIQTHSEREHIPTPVVVSPRPDSQPHAQGQGWRDMAPEGQETIGYPTPGYLDHDSDLNARYGHNAIEPPAPGRNAPVREPNWAALDHPHIVREEHRPLIAHVLWAYQNWLRNKLNPNARSLPANDIPGGSLDAIVLLLSRYSPADCKHALDVQAAEGECLRTQGRDPLEYLNGRTNWKPEQFERAASATVEAIYKRYEHRPKPAMLANEPSHTYRRLA